MQIFPIIIIFLHYIRQLSVADAEIRRIGGGDYNKGWSIWH